MASTRLSLAQQILQLEDAAPVDLDPEDLQAASAEPADCDPLDAAAAREHYLEVGPSALRKLHASISDPKYDGVKTSRRQLEEETDEDDLPSDQEAEDDMHMEGEDAKHDGSRDPSGDEHNPSDSETESRSRAPQDAERSIVPSQAVSEPPDAASSSLKHARDEDRKKGKAVSRQIALWDALLDARIRLQKAITASHTLPPASRLPEYAANSDCRAALNRMFTEAASLSNELFDLREDLLRINTQTTPPPRKKRRIEALTDDTDFRSLFNEDAQHAAALEQSYHPYLIQTLSKWSSKIQAVAPSVLLPSNRNAFSSKSQQHLKSVVQHIDDTLVDHQKLLARTQVRRTKKPRLDADITQYEDKDDSPDGEVPDVELFDDTDFYQQLLRDVIDARGEKGSGADDWMALQKQKKAKKKVDTKASKGRKLRYEVHEKLQNFMVPVPVQGGWHDEQIDELFASLLGTGLTNNLPDEPEPEGGVSQLLPEQLAGFRVFG